MYRLGLLHSGLFLQCLTHSWCSESICPLPIFVDYGFIISLFHEFHEGGDLLLTVFLPQNSVNKPIHSLPVQLDVTVYYFRYVFMCGLSENRDTQQSSSRRHHAPETMICGYLWEVGCGLPVCNIVRLSHRVSFQINPIWDVVQWQSLTWVRLWVQSSGQ